MYDRLRLLTLLGLLAITLGCASAYHRYADCGGVDCRYCVPPPLPHTQYPEGVCHSAAAEGLVGTQSVSPSTTQTEDR